MEAVIKEKEETTIKEEKKGKRKWGSIIFNFLAMGGWLLVLIFILGIVILVSTLGK
jgi:hypothetical protein